jgi:excisionase family DNA binding protein
MLLTVKDLSSLLRIAPSTLYDWVKRGKIPARNLNGLIRFHPTELREWFESGRAQTLTTLLPFELGKHAPIDLETLIARAKREVYTPPHGETKPESSLIGKEDADGAV